LDHTAGPVSWIAPGPGRPVTWSIELFAVAGMQNVDASTPNLTGAE